jgi:hypothetical protein
MSSLTCFFLLILVFQLRRSHRKLNESVLHIFSLWRNSINRFINRMVIKNYWNVTRSMLHYFLLLIQLFVGYVQSMYVTIAYKGLYRSFSSFCSTVQSRFNLSPLLWADAATSSQRCQSDARSHFRSFHAQMCWKWVIPFFHRPHALPGTTDVPTLLAAHCGSYHPTHGSVKRWEIGSQN